MCDTYQMSHISKLSHIFKMSHISNMWSDHTQIDDVAHIKGVTHINAWSNVTRDHMTVRATISNVTQISICVTHIYVWHKSNLTHNKDVTHIKWLWELTSEQGKKVQFSKVSLRINLRVLISVRAEIGEIFFFFPFFLSFFLPQFVRLNDCESWILRNYAPRAR